MYLNFKKEIFSPWMKFGLANHETLLHYKTGYDYLQIRRMRTLEKIYSLA
jgi:hypothetical protein